jgi:hypothetical protein
MALQRDVQMHGIGREMLQVLLKLRDFLPELVPQQLVPVQVFGYEIPGKCHMPSFLFCSLSALENRWGIS